jgi:hypothetical protein
MPAKTTEKGEIGEAMVIADLMRQGHEIAIPFGHNQPYELVVIRKEDGRLEKVQVKYTTSNGVVVRCVIRSSTAWVAHRYTADEVDWIAVFDATTSQCFYLPAWDWDGQTQLALRFKPTQNGQSKGIRWAANYTRLSGEPHSGPPGSVGETALPLDVPPE